MNGQNKILMMGMAVLVLAAVAFWLLRGDAPAPIEPSPMVPVPHPEPVAAAAAADPATEPERAEVTATAPSAAVPDLHLAHVRGRCVDEHGQPLADCTAKLGGWGANSTRVAMQGGVDWHDPEPIVTNTDGRFDLAFASAVGSAVLVRCLGRRPRAAHRHDRTAVSRWQPVRADRVPRRQVRARGDAHAACREVEVRFRERRSRAARTIPCNR